MAIWRLSALDDRSVGVVLDAVRGGHARSRAEVERLTGMSRPTVADRVATLLEAGLLIETDLAIRSGGRPAKGLAVNRSGARVLGVDIGERRTRIALTDPLASVLGESVVEVPVAEGPRAVIAAVLDAADELLGEIPGAPLVAVGIGMPAPVDFATGTTVGWSVMAGWASFDVRALVRERIDVPVIVDNDVNLLTIAEHRRFWAREQHLYYVKAGTGVGSGLIVEGRLNRGAKGAAGDIGHAHIAGYGDPTCRCGNSGCVESFVGGWALARSLRAAGAAERVEHARDVVALVRHGNVDAVAGLRQAGRILGEALATATSILNPSVLVLGGMLAYAGDHLLAGVREVVYQRALPLATNDLVITPSRLDAHGAVEGAAFLAVDTLLAPRV